MCCGSTTWAKRLTYAPGEEDDVFHSQRLPTVPDIPITETLEKYQGLNWTILPLHPEQDQGK